MAENIYFDLSEEIQQDLENEYRTLCDEVKQTLSHMNEKMEEICTRTKYEPMVNAVNQTIELLDNDIRQNSTQAFEEWIEGEGSFKAAAVKSQSGESAVQTAAAIESNIREMFEDFWNSHPMGTGFQLDTSRPMVKDEDFEELGECYKDYSQKCDDLGEKTLSSIRQKGEDDPTYNIILPAVRAVTGSLKASFEEFTNKISEAKDKSEELKQAQSQSNEEALGTATNTTATASDIAEELKMYEDL